MRARGSEIGLLLIESIIVGIFASLVASVMFLLWTRLLTPKIQISPYISVYPNDNGDNRDTYRVKIVNHRYRSVSDLTISVFVQHLQQVKNGPVKVKKRIGTRSSIHSMQRRKFRDTEFDNCRRIRIEGEALEDVYLHRSNPHVIVEVYCRDSWSGVGRLIRQEYAGIDSFKRGSFVHGMSSEIEDYRGHAEMVLLKKLRDRDQLAASNGTPSPVGPPENAAS